MYDNGDYDDFRRDINSTYGIEDIYAEEEPAVAPQPQYGMPWYQPRFGEGVYGGNTQPAQPVQPQPQVMGQWQRRPSAKTDPMMPVSDSTMNVVAPKTGAKPIIPKKEEETSPWNFDKL
jgi:hypothetical protein